MRFIGIINLWICVLLRRDVGASKYLFFENSIAIGSKSGENLSEKFFLDFSEVPLKNMNPRYVTVIGASANSLWDIQFAFSMKNYPVFIVYTEIKYLHSIEFNLSNLFMIFLNRRRIEMFEDDLEILSRFKPYRIIFVLSGNFRIDEIRILFNLCYERNILLIGLAYFHGNDHVDFYHFHKTENCSMLGTVDSVSWRPETGYSNRRERPDEVTNLDGCIVNVSFVDFLPEMQIEKNADGSLSIVGGREGKLLLTLAEKLNFTLKLRYSTAVDSGNVSQKLSIVNDVAYSGSVEFGIGQLRPINSFDQLVTFSKIYDNDCITWGVPYITSWHNNILAVEFSWKVWCWIVVVFVISCGTEYFDRNVDMRRKRENHSAANRRRNFNKFGEFGSVLLNVFSFHLGNAVVRLPKTFGGKLMLLIYLWYAIVMTTGYKSFLASHLATDVSTSYIVSTEDIIRHNLNVGGSFDDYEILKDQASERKNSQILMDRFIINNNNTETLNRLKHSRSYALMVRASFLNFAKKECFSSGETITFDTLGECVLIYRSVIVFNKKSHLLRPINNVIQRLEEAGILEYWDHDGDDIETKVHSARTESYSKEQLTNKFRFIFKVYIYCIVICLAAFFIELLIPRLGIFQTFKNHCDVFDNKSNTPDIIIH